MGKISILFISAAMVSVTPVYALTFELSPNTNRVGGAKVHIAKSGETLLDIGHHYSIGAIEMRRANPGLAGKRLRNGTTVRIPSTYQLPSGPREGIVLNIAEMRVYYYHPDGTKVSTYPVGVGKQGWGTPLGNTTIIRKVKNPTWNPPPSIIKEAARRGKQLRAVGPGPRNPLGRYAMYLGIPRILMHGTTSPSSIGLRSSHGCIRMFNKDIAELFNYVTPGTSMRIVYEPKK